MSRVHSTRRRRTCDFTASAKLVDRQTRFHADVLKVISGHFAEVPDRDEDPRRNARRLIALGVALHCQQDAYSHVGFDGSCGPYPGSCFGHTYQTFLDQVVFGLLKKHRFNPDHPGVSGRWLLQALQGTVNELAVRRPKGSLRSIPANELVALSDDLRGSGLELPDEVRRDCNRYIAGKWLFDFFHSGSGTQTSTDALERLAPEVAVTCKNASLASATIVRIPDPRFPRLNPDASPYLVRADGTYQLVRDGRLQTPPCRASTLTTTPARSSCSCHTGVNFCYCTSQRWLAQFWLLSDCDRIGAKYGSEV